MLAPALLFLSAGSAMADAAGGAQLAQAFDAAFTRVVEKGIYREMILTFDEPATALPTGIQAQDYIINMSDCLPNTALTPFPVASKNPLKRIIKKKEIRRGILLSSVLVTPGGTTSDWFTRGDPDGDGNSDQSDFLFEAILAEIEAHYGLDPGEIHVTEIEIPFPFNTTSALQDGIFGFSVNPTSIYGFFAPVSLPGVTVDFLDQFNAKGGRSENLRRLGSREETCTLSASGQFIQIPEANMALVAAITSIDDLAADDSVKICTGNLSTQLTSAYFPNHDVFASRDEDIVECYQRLADGLADAFCPPSRPGLPNPPAGSCHSDVMMSSLPVIPTDVQLGVPGPGPMAPSVDTDIVAGTPYWTIHQGITCFPVASPPGLPAPFGSFRNCTVD
jgi:hypothetical protein